MFFYAIVPTSNSSAFLPECLSSIASSSIAGLTVSVVDNCSTDQTLSQLLTFRSLGVSLEYVSQQDTGPAQALNTGFTMALASDAEIVGWLNSDDYYAPKAIDKVIAAFAKNPKLKIVYGLGRHVNEHGKDLGSYPSLPPTTPINTFTQGSFICQPTVFFRKEVFSEVGLLDEKLKTAFDFDLWLRIFKHYKPAQIGFIKEVLAYSRLHSQCLTKRLRQTVALESMQVIARHLGSAPAHWIVTYFDELCERYPFIDEKESLVDIVKAVLLKAKPYMKPDALEKLVKDLQADWRLRLANSQAFANVEPDGWVSKRLVVKLRYAKTGKRSLRLVCRGGWPKEADLHLTICSADGEIEKVKLGTQDEFMLNLEAPPTVSEAFTTWVIETKQSFIPAKTIKKSKDTRSLSFKVEAMELV
jgi:glycosyltransferase involved in cell wall biosynthesis